MIVAGIVYAAAMIAFAWSRSFALSVAILAVLGFADATWGTMRSAIVQLAADDAYRGRVMSLLIMVGRGLTQGSQLQTGIVTALVGPTSAATFGAIVVGAIVAAVAARAPRLRDFSAAARRPRLAEAAQAGGES
jgi:hypothetical protein